MTELSPCPFCAKHLVEWQNFSSRSAKFYGHPGLADDEEACILSDIRIIASNAPADHERVARWNRREMIAEPVEPEAGPPTGIAREAYGVKIPFVVDCLRQYAEILRQGLVDTAGHYFPCDIEEAADMLEQGDTALLDVAERIVGSLAYTPDRIAAMNELREIVERLKAA